MRTVHCNRCRHHEIKESEVIEAREVGRMRYDGQPWKSTTWKWTARDGHYGYGPEPFGELAFGVQDPLPKTYMK